MRGLGPILTHFRLDIEPGIQGFSFGTTQPADYTIEDLRPTFRAAYVILLRVDIRVMKLMSPKGSSLRALRPMFVRRRK